jgi:hypothetical protein
VWIWGAVMWRPTSLDVVRRRQSAIGDREPLLCDRRAGRAGVARGAVRRTSVEMTNVL